MNAWVVAPDERGGWDVRRPPFGESAFRAADQDAAEAWVRAAAEPGAVVVVRSGTGQPLTQFVVPAGSRESAGGPPGLVARLDQEGERWDTWLEFGAVVGVALFAGVASEVISPEVLAAASNGWIAVFFATLTWSLGCAGATYAIKAHKLEGYDAAGAALVSLVVALGIASWLGTGVLDVTAGWQEGGGHPLFRGLFAFFYSAVVTYGFVGALLGGGIGYWLGDRLATRFPG